MGAFLAVSAILPSAPAAPVPTHLMPPEPPLFPTRVGTKWVYSSADGESTHVITRVEKKGDGDRITVESSGAGSGIDGVWSLRPDGLFLVEGPPLFAGGGHLYGNPWCLVRPSRSAEPWKAAVTVEGGGTNVGFLKVVAVEQVEVPAGTFHATRVAWNKAVGDYWQAEAKTYWYVAGLGVVQVGDPPVWRLKSFELGK